MIEMRFSDVFFFNDTATTEIYTLSLHDALPISPRTRVIDTPGTHLSGVLDAGSPDRKSTRLNSSHQLISYAVFCLKTKKTNPTPRRWAVPPSAPRPATGPPGQT